MAISIDSKEKKITIIPVYKKETSFEFFTKQDENIKKEATELNFNCEKNETCMLKINNKKIILISIPQNYTKEDLRNAYSTILTFVKSKKEKEIQINIPKENEEEIIAVVEGLDLSNYKFDMYMSKKDEIKIEIGLNINSKYKDLISKTLKITSNTKFVRDMVNENADSMTPEKIANIAKEIAKKNKLKINILDEKKIKSLGLNLMYNVGKGSNKGARLVIIEYNGNPKSKEKTALIGKGLTYDTGGLNLKQTGFMETMKYDMAGAATALGTFKSAVGLGIKKNIIVVLGCVENAIDANSYKPGDAIKSYNGKFVEIANTDAEGRLVLADCITYTQKFYKPTNIINMATLTGACAIALGPSLIAILGNNEEMKQQIFKAGEYTNDRGWILPIYDEHRELNKSKFADIKNSGGRAGGTITAAAFIESFIDKEVKWVHLDIAGAAFTDSQRAEKYLPSYGATATGVRLLVNYLENN